MSNIHISKLIKRFGPVEAVSDISFEVTSGHILGLLGPSGCGKTTLLKCIAGLEDPSEGEIRIDGKLVSSPSVSVPPERRAIGMVFQSYALWPHKTVQANVAYPLQVRRLPAAEIARRVADALQLVGLDALARRYPSELSGGQQQRVALARSIVHEPQILLFDEPLSNLDANTRLRVRGELKRLLRRVGITSIYITHDYLEAMAICDRVALMHRGKIIQSGSPEELYNQPVSPVVAELLGSGNFLDGTVRAVDATNRQIAVAINDLTILCPLREPAAPGQARRVLLRFDDIALSTTRPDAPNSWEARVIDQSNFGGYREFVLALGGIELIVHSRTFTCDTGDTIFAHIDPGAVISFAADA